MKTTRRYVPFVGALVLIVAVLVGATALELGSEAVAAPGAAPAGSVPTAVMAPLPEVVCKVVRTTRTCQLWALPGTLAMPDGRSIPVWGFADSETEPAQVPGPVIRARAGETLEVVFHNGIPGETVSLAFPGQQTIPDMDGAQPGHTKIYRLSVPNPGTFLYEAGLTAGGARQVAMGLAGVLIVENEAPTWSQEATLVFSEIDPAFNSDPLNFSMASFRPRYWLVNGRAYPNTGHIGVAAGETILMRYLNAGMESRSVALLGVDQEILAADGEKLPFPLGAVAAPLAPGQTMEAVVRVPTSAATDTLYSLYNASLHQHNNNQRLADKRAAFGGMLAFLRVTVDGAAPTPGPVASNVTVTPQKTNGAAGAVLSATLTGHDSNVVAYEYFVDAIGGPGTGAGTDIAGPALSVQVQVNFSAGTLATWSSGDHTLYIRGRDALGNWGSVGSAVVILDKAGPVITGLGLSPNPTNGTANVALSGTADDSATGNSNVQVAAFRTDGGSWQPMSVSPTGSPVAGLSATITAATLATMAEGGHQVEVRAQDELGNWSQTVGTIQLRLDRTGPNVSAVTLNPSQLDFTRPPTVTSVRLAATVADPLSNGVQSAIASAEGYIGQVGAPGTGFALFPADGLFDGAREDVYYDIPASQFATLGSGDHQVLVVGRDSAGNLGPAGAATISVVTGPVDGGGGPGDGGDGSDVAGPSIGNLVADPNPTAGARTVVVTATATDARSNVVGAVWFRGTDPTKTATYQMAAADGAFDSTSEGLTVSIDVTKWGHATHQLSVRARDAKGNWGPVATIEFVVNR